MRKLAFGSILLFGATCTVAADSPQQLPLRFGSWTKGNCIDRPAGSPLSEEAGGKGGAISCEYVSGEKKVQVLVQKLRDPSAAYEVYTAGLHPGMMASFVGTNAAVDKDQLWMLTGDLVLRVDSQKLASEAD